MKINCTKGKEYRWIQPVINKWAGFFINRIKKTRYRKNFRWAALYNAGGNFIEMCGRKMEKNKFNFIVLSVSVLPELSVQICMDSVFDIIF